jgi:hypothetical protein
MTGLAWHICNSFIILMALDEIKKPVTSGEMFTRGLEMLASKASQQQS